MLKVLASFHSFHAVILMYEGVSALTDVRKRLGGGTQAYYRRFQNLLKQPIRVLTYLEE